MIDPARLYHKLQVTGLANTDPRLHQLIYEMIGAVLGMNKSVNSVVSLVDDLPTDTGGTDNTGAMTPIFIESGDTFTIPEDKQAVFAMNIDNEGIIDCEGFLIEVD